MPVLFTKPLRDKNEKYIEPDGAGIIYPYVANKNWNSVYRVEAKLKLRVDIAALESAVKEMKNKYPYFFSCVGIHGKKYVLKSGCLGGVLVENAEMCRPFDLKNRDTLLRVVYTLDTIGVEFFHGITDGHGAQLFLDELLKEYCNIAYSGYSYDTPKTTMLPVNERLNKLDDIYNEAYTLGGKSVSRFLSKAYQFKSKENTELSTECISVFAEPLKAAAHKYGATVTEYLCAVQLVAIIKSENVKSKTVRISIPVDIRKYFATETSRNASLYFLVEVKPNNISDFQSLINTVKVQFNKNLTKGNMQNLAYSNVKCAKMKAYTFLPVILKKAVLNIGYTVFGENQFTSTLTNLGKAKMSPAVRGLVSEVYYILGKEKTKPLNMTVTTYEDETKIIISSTIDSTNFVRTISEILIADEVIGTAYPIAVTEAQSNNFDAVS